MGSRFHTLFDFNLFHLGLIYLGEWSQVPRQPVYRNIPKYTNLQGEDGKTRILVSRFFPVDEKKKNTVFKAWGKETKTHTIPLPYSWFFTVFIETKPKEVLV